MVNCSAAKDQKKANDTILLPQCNSANITQGKWWLAKEKGVRGQKYVGSMHTKAQGMFW